MASNLAAYLTAHKAPLEVKPAPMPEPEEFEIVVRSRAVAINPVDYFQQISGPKIFQWLKYPAILGYDVAGEVTTVGSSVTKFQVGDRVAGFSRSTFQHFVVVKEHLLTTLPNEMSFEKAAVFPLTLATAVKSLFHPEFLALDLPSSQAKPKNKAVLIWGGSTNVGSNAIQLATAAGYEVITTASPRNFDYVRKLGASEVFDYNSPSVQESLLMVVEGKSLIGAVANGGTEPGDYKAIVDICAAVLQSKPESRRLLPCTMVPRFDLPDGVQCKFAESLEGDRELAAAIFHDYLPGALADGSFVPSPSPQVVGSGLGAIQEAMDALERGVSASKIVVSIQAEN